METKFKKLVMIFVVLTLIATISFSSRSFYIKHDVPSGKIFCSPSCKDLLTIYNLIRIKRNKG